MGKPVNHRSPRGRLLSLRVLRVEGGKVVFEATFKNMGRKALSSSMEIGEAGALIEALAKARAERDL